MRFRVTWKGTTASTNDDVWALARAGEPAGACVASFAQESGRGTWKRVWESPRGGLYFSFLLRPRTPQAIWPESSILLAQTCAQVIRDFCGVADGIVRVKPKNDVVCDAGKLAGISLEAASGPMGATCPRIWKTSASKGRAGRWGRFRKRRSKACWTPISRRSGGSLTCGPTCFRTVWR